MAAVEAEEILEKYASGNPPIYVVGTFDAGVTVYTQQVRALNLVWALVETGTIECIIPESKDKPQIRTVAIVGGGFAGLSVAAALLEKGAAVEITLFEQYDTLLPLQHGSDARWLHPKIYDWPAEDNESSVAMLPVLNWNAARASDVAVQVLGEWRRVAEPAKNIRVFCNARHVRIEEKEAKFRVEWVGEARAFDGQPDDPAQSHAKGQSKPFDIVICTAGFGLERDADPTYWRNDQFAQPNLAPGRRTYVVSGQGDGAIIDLLRLRVSEFRQDRILQELFGGATGLLVALREAEKKIAELAEKQSCLHIFEELEGTHEADFKRVCAKLQRRLRRDTDVILAVRVKKIAELFRKDYPRLSFQNRLMLYLLYRTGGFTPAREKLKALRRRYGLSEADIIRRHGPDREASLKALLSKSLWTSVKTKRPSQSHKECWPGGYFGFPGTSAKAATLPDKFKAAWRREYLPGPTELAATAFASGLAATLLKIHGEEHRLRVTLHRAALFGKEEVLQQCCEYQGVSAVANERGAGRTFPADKGMIGAAYKARAIVRSTKGATSEQLQEAMKALELPGSREMAKEVDFLLAIPILEPEEAGKFIGPTPIAGIVFVDSKKPEFFLEGEELERFVLHIQRFLDALQPKNLSLDRVRNIQLAGGSDKVRDKEKLPANVGKAIEILEDIDLPRVAQAFQFNFDYQEFVPTNSKS